MKRIVSITFVLILAGIMVASSADAGWFGNKDKDKDKEKKMVPRYDEYPSMGFTQGRLGRDSYSGWKVGQYEVRFTGTCQVVNEDGEAADLQEGRKALIMGPRWGNTVIAWRVKIMSSLENQGNQDPNVHLQEGESPYVAVGTAPQ